jgi:hypothetical protein
VLSWKGVAVVVAAVAAAVAVAGESVDTIVHQTAAQADRQISHCDRIRHELDIKLRGEYVGRKRAAVEESNLENALASAAFGI